MVIMAINKNCCDTSVDEINPQIPAEMSDNQYGFAPISS